MVCLIATVHVKPGRRDEFLEAFKSNLPAVVTEKGCIEYFPTVDAPADLPPQQLDENAVTILEKWESLGALSDHLAAPHMAAYRERVKDIVVGLELKVLREA